MKIAIDVERIRPPYKSKWPDNVPSERELREKYYPEDFFNNKTRDRGFIDIWSSVMYNVGSLADFGNYILGSQVGHWTGRRFDDSRPRRRQLLDQFLRGLTHKQWLLWKNKDPIYILHLGLLGEHIMPGEPGYVEHPGESSIKDKSENPAGDSDRAFKESLTNTQRAHYEREIESISSWASHSRSTGRL